MKTLEDVGRFWNQRAQEQKTDLERVDSSARSQQARFGALVDILPLDKSFTLLDVGCGVGDLYDRLLDSHDCDYQGVDLSEAMVARAKQKYPNGHFAVSNILECKDRKIVDYVASISIHSEIVDDAERILFSMMVKQFELCKVATHISLLSSRSAHTRDKQAWDPLAVVKLAFELTSKVVLRTDYLPHDFSVTLYR